MFRYLTIQNPKRSRGTCVGRASWYPYYAGFSPNFAHSLLASSDLQPDACIIDSWNGSGTTTDAAAVLGYRTYGYDLNPAMVVVAKARMLSRREKSSLWPIAVDLLNKAARDKVDKSSTGGDDPLCTWLMPRSAAVIRKLDESLQILLVDNTKYQPLAMRGNIDFLSDLAAFFYTALFRTVRVILKQFFTSNPTWIKQPKDKNARLNASLLTILDAFKAEVRTMVAAIDDDPFDNTSPKAEACIHVASSTALPAPDNFGDFVLASPPYCTRIDYAVATMAELAVLGYMPNENFRDLRRSLIGTSTVPTSIQDPLPEWGPTCSQFLGQLIVHRSRASRSYYYKNHIQYFDAIYRSISELHRTLKPGGICILVVQDSYYKDIHNDLPQIFIEMASANGLQLGRRVDFSQTSIMARINPTIRKYRNASSATESVLCFVNT